MRQGGGARPTAALPIDAAVSLFDGRQIDGPKAFREALLSRGDEFIRTVTEKLLTYALGRGVDYHDAPRCGNSCGMQRETTTAGRPSCWGL